MFKKKIALLSVMSIILFSIGTLFTNKSTPINIAEALGGVCGKEIYYFSGNSLYSANLTTGAKTLVGNSGASSQPNAAGYNQIDGKIWGFDRTKKVIYSVDATYAFTFFTNITGATIFDSGDVDASGILFLYADNTATMRRFNLSGAVPVEISALTLSAPINGVDDLAFNPVDGQIYLVRGDNRNMYRINPTTGVVTNLGVVTGVPLASGNYGAHLFDNAGNLYILRNGTVSPGGNVYKISLVQSLPASGSPAATLITSIVGGVVSTGVDGAGCPNVSRFNVVTVEQGPAPQTDPSPTVPVNFIATFDVAIDPFTFTCADVSITSGSATGESCVSITPTDLTNKTFIIEATAIGNGTIIASIPHGVITDIGGDLNSGSTSIDNSILFGTDTVNPEVTINQKDTQIDPTSRANIIFTAVFDEPINVSTFSCADVSVINGTCNSITFVSGSTYSIAVTATAPGVITATIPAGVVGISGIEDIAGNPNNASTSTDNNVTLVTDMLPPVVVITAPTITSLSTITDTTITVTDDIEILASDVTIDASTTVSYNSFNCIQTSDTQVDCTIQITSGGMLRVNGVDGAANTANDIEPVYTFLIPTVIAPDLVNAHFPTITGACETGMTVNIIISPTSENLTTSCVASAYSVTATVSVPTGAYTATASETDGVTTSASVSDPGIITVSGGGGGGVISPTPVATTSTSSNPRENDGASSQIEDAGPNNGDGNGDGIKDSEQQNVITLKNPSNNKYITMHIEGDCETNTAYKWDEEREFSVQDPTGDYFLGLHEFHLNCREPGTKVKITYIWDKKYNTKNWLYKKYNPTTGQYSSDINSDVTYGIRKIAGVNRSTSSYYVTDGGKYDIDGKKDGKIWDPAGPTIVVKSTEIADQKIVVTPSPVSSDVFYDIKKLPKILPKTGAVKVLKNAEIETDVASWNKKIEVDSISDAPTDAQHWIDAIPYEQDKNAERYIVIPTRGIVSPIIGFGETSKEYIKMTNSQDVDINKFLRGGTLQYAGTADTEYQNGNMVIFGHSSYFKKNSSRYKTVFTALPEITTGEEVWIYNKTSEGKYSLSRYRVTESYETKKDDVGVLKPVEGKSKIVTLFTCTPIGGAHGRWIVRAEKIQ